MASAKELNESQVHALGLEALLLSAITDEVADASNPGRPLQRGGLDASVKPLADSGGLKAAAVSLAGGNPATIGINDLPSTFPALQWVPWGGRPGAPPQLITLTGILDEATAATTAISRDSSLGVAPAGALRQAALSVIGISITTCKKLADFACGFGGLDTDAARACTPGFASLTMAAGAEGSAVAAAQRRATDATHALQQLLDIIPAAAVTLTATRGSQQSHQPGRPPSRQSSHQPSHQPGHQHSHQSEPASIACLRATG